MDEISELNESNDNNKFVALIDLIVFSIIFNPDGHFLSLKICTPLSSLVSKSKKPIARIR